jgi:hypothetical protein
MSVPFILTACIAWTLYCGFLSAVFDQPREADGLATAIGLLLILVAAIAAARVSKLPTNFVTRTSNFLLAEFVRIPGATLLNFGAYFLRRRCASASASA